MGKTIVTAPLFYTGNEGWLEAGTSIVVASSLLLKDVARHTCNHLFVCEFNSEQNQSTIKHLISEGMKRAHQEAEDFMVLEFGDDWKERASYSFGDLDYAEIDG